jgi:hypothetical protein
MLTLAEYRRAIDEIEKRNGPPTVDVRDAAVKSLVHEINGRPWDTAEARERAQSLVIRLELLRYTATD